MTLGIYSLFSTKMVYAELLLVQQMSGKFRKVLAENYFISNVLCNAFDIVYHTASSLWVCITQSSYTVTVSYPVDVCTSIYTLASTVGYCHTYTVTLTPQHCT